MSRNTIPLGKRPWVTSIGIFVWSQIIFMTFEVTGWIPNLGEMDGMLFGNIVESSLFKGSFTFYETAHFNLITVFFVIVFFIPGMVGAIKDIFSFK